MTDERRSGHTGAGDDLYAILGVPPGATDEEITRAYRRLARQHHPDTNPGAPADAFAGVTDAYDVLSEPGRRRAYDGTLGARARAADAAGVIRIPVRPAAPSDRGPVGPREDSPASAHGVVPPPTASPPDLEVALSFDQAALGTTAVVPIRAETPCPACAGTATAGSAPTSCTACDGAGVTVRTSGGITIRSECPACEGRGHGQPVPCVACEGTGRQEVTRDVKVRVPPGVEEGTRLRIPLGGDAAPWWAVVRTAPHPYFGRRGDDLTVRVPITLAEAALGAVVTVPTLASAVAIRIPPGTPPGRTLRVRGRGIERRSGQPGDLLVTVDVVVPSELNDGQRAALEAYAAATESPRTHFESSAEAPRRSP